MCKSGGGYLSKINCWDNLARLFSAPVVFQIIHEKLFRNACLWIKTHFDLKVDQILTWLEHSVFWGAPNRPKQDSSDFFFHTFFIRGKAWTHATLCPTYFCFLSPLFLQKNFNVSLIEDLTSRTWITTFFRVFWLTHYYWMMILVANNTIYIFSFAQWT